MAVPKRKTSRKRRDQRSSTWGLQMKTIAYCPNSGAAVQPHTVCLESGFYKGVKVMDTKADRALRRQAKRKKVEMRSEAAAPEAPEAAPEVVVESKPAAKKAKKAAAPKKETK